MWRVLAVSVLALSCVKRAPEPSAVSGESLALGVWVESQPDATRVVPPVTFVAELVRAIEAHGLKTKRIEEGEAKFARQTDARLAELRATGAPLQLVVDLSARYHSQISGRYRWNVSVSVALGGRARSEDHFDVPVALEFEHERAAEAVAAASKEIARRVGALVIESTAVAAPTAGSSAPAATPAAATP